MAETTKEYFRFQKVEDYFSTVSSWDAVQKAEKCQWNEEKRTLVLHLKTSMSECPDCDMLIQILTGSSFRLQFHPGKKEEDYSDYNSRAVIQDTFSELAEMITAEEFEAEFDDSNSDYAELRFHGSLVHITTIVRVRYNPFEIEVLRNPDGSDEFCRIFGTSCDGLRFTPAGGMDDYHIVQTVNKPLSAKYVGFGEQGGLNLMKNKQRVTYFNYDNMKYSQVYGRGPLEEREPLYHSDPFFMEVNGVPEKESVYGIFIDNPSETLLDMGYYNSAKYQFGIRYGMLDYYVIVGNSCGDIIKSFSNIVGTSRLVPRFALGYHQGCYGYECRNDLEETVRRYRENKIPLDGLHVDVDLQNKYQTFTVDQEKFGDPKEMFGSLRAQGVKCSTNITPIISNRNTENYQTYQEGIKNHYFVTDERFDPENPDGRTYYKYAGGVEYEYPFNDKEENYNTGKPFVGEVYYGNKGSEELGTSGHYPDLNRKEVRQWWGKQYEYLFSQGLEMVWQDMTTPCLRDSRGDMLSFPSRLLVNNDYTKSGDGNYEKTPVMRIWNLYSYNLHKATYHGLNNLECRKNKRNFIVGRGCFTGMQRFAALWTGDNSSNWEFLKINISQVLALGLTGQALSGQDIGGFEPDKEGEQWADPELVIRWTAMGAFLPWFRNHYIRKGRKLFQEPYAFQDVIGQVSESEEPMYRAVLPVCKYYIELRYRLLQLFYDAMFENTLNGMPICRPLFVTNPEDKTLFGDSESFMDTEFMVGNDLLVAPVLEKQSAENGYVKRDVYLPAGSRWYQFTDSKCRLGNAVDGGTNISQFDAHISDDEGHIPYIVPMYVREGAVLPEIELEQYVGQKWEQKEANTITLNIYPGQRGDYTMYLDDGISRSSQPEKLSEIGADPEAKGEYREVQIHHEWKETGHRCVEIKRVHDGYTPVYEKYMFLAILHDADEPENIPGVVVNGEQLENLPDRNACINAEGHAMYYDSGVRITYIKLVDDCSEFNLDLQYFRY